MFKIEHPAVTRVSEWLRKHPFITATLVVVAFILKDLPQWLSSVWALRSSKPFFHSLGERMQGIHFPDFSYYWIPRVIGWVVLVSVLYLLIRSRRAKNDGEPKGNFAKRSDERLHKIAENDKAKISEYVWVTSIYHQKVFDKSQPYIDFVFNIFNNSLFDIVINFQNGFILYGDDWEQFHLDPKFIGRTPTKCWSRNPTNFVIRQAVTQDEITRRFSKPDNIRITFGNLKINFLVEQFAEMDAVPLDVNHHLQTAEHAWFNPNHPAFPSSYKDEQYPDLITSLETATGTTQDKSRLKFLRFSLELVYKDDYGKILRYESKPRTATWRMNHPSHWALIAYYRNAPDESREPKSVRKVSAELTYRLPNETNFLVPRALWFPDSVSSVDINYNDERGFILAEQFKRQEIYGRNKSELIQLGSKTTVQVRLISEGDGSITNGGTFELKGTRKGSDDFYINAKQIS